MSRHLPAAVLVLAMALGACSGGGEEPAASTTAAAVTDAPSAEPDAGTTAGASAADDAPTEDALTPDAATPTAAAPDADAAAAEELPQFISDFERVCTTGVGFGGTTPYEQVPGVHPVVLMEEQYGGTVIQATEEFPAGWSVEEDLNFDDASELAITELIACSTLASSTPNGTTCELDGDDGAITLSLLDGTYDLTIHAASTGEELHATTIEAATTECPTFVFIEEGQDEYLNSPTSDQYIQALQPFVAPS